MCQLASLMMLMRSTQKWQRWLLLFARYTREAGVRSLDRKLGAICRAVAVKVAEGQHKEGKPDRSDGTEGEGLCAFYVLLLSANQCQLSNMPKKGGGHCAVLLFLDLHMFCLSLK